MSRPTLPGPTSPPTWEELHTTLEAMREDGWLTSVTAATPDSVERPADALTERLSRGTR